jgi:hypothetical protein
MTRRALNHSAAAGAWPRTEPPVPLKAGALDRLTKILPRLASSSDVEALQACRALSKELKAIGCDFNDLADNIRETGIGDHEAPAKPKSWSELDTGDRFTWFRKLCAAPWLDTDERARLVCISDKYCLVPARHPEPEICAIMDDLLTRWRKAEP